MGVKVSETMPETRTAKLKVTANSWNKRPTSPPMNRSGMKTATSEVLMEITVKPICLAPLSAASMEDWPFSIYR